MQPRTIKLRPTPPSAYNDQRPANALILAQVTELEKAVRAAGRKVRPMTVTTEADAAARIRHLNRALHHQVLLPAIKRRPVGAPPQNKPAIAAKAKRSRKK